MRYYCNELSFIRKIQGVESQKLTHAAHLFPYRHSILINENTHLCLICKFIKNRRSAAACRITQHGYIRHRFKHRLDEMVKRRRIALNSFRKTDSMPLSHDGCRMVTKIARYNYIHPRFYVKGRNICSLYDIPDPSRIEVNSVTCSASDNLRVSRDDTDACLICCLPHIGKYSFKALNRKSFLQNHTQRKIFCLRSRHCEVIYRTAHCKSSYTSPRKKHWLNNIGICSKSNTPAHGKLRAVMKSVQNRVPKRRKNYLLHELCAHTASCTVGKLYLIFHIGTFLLRICTKPHIHPPQIPYTDQWNVQAHTPCRKADSHEV